MLLALQGVTGSQHIKGSIEDGTHVTGPDGRSIEKISTYNFKNKTSHHGENQERHKLSAPDADPVYGVRHANKSFGRSCCQGIRVFHIE
jgi:hypothetical protein